MGGGRRRLRVAALAVVAAAATGLTLLPAPVSAAPLPARNGTRCYAADVVGLGVIEARSILRELGCRRGATRDGNHFRITYACTTVAQVGLVLDQRPTGRLLAPRGLLSLVVGSIDATPQCRAAADSRYDGTYSAVAAITGSVDPDLPAGSIQEGLSFAVTGGSLSGALSGTVGLTGVSTDAVLTFNGRSCPISGGLRFSTFEASPTLVRGDYSCTGAPAVTGVFSGFQN